MILVDFKLLSKYDIAFPHSLMASSVQEVQKAAEKVGYPLAIKAISPQVLHKSERGGVLLGINTPQEALKAAELLSHRYKGVKLDGFLVQRMAGSKTSVELIVGGKKDAQFGQLLMLGMGGIFVEVFKDVSFRVCPINEDDAKEMIGELVAHPILAGARGRKPINESALVSTLLKVSRLLQHENPKEFDLNPVFADEKGCVAVDMRIIH